MGKIEEAIRRAREDRLTATGQYAALGGQQRRRTDGADWRDATHPNNAELVIEAHIPAAHIVEVDNEQLREHRVIAASEHDERVGAYRQLRTLILKTMRDNQWMTLAITSADEGAGKTLTAANLAISLSRDVNTSVLLVDLDLRKPTVNRILNLQSDKGLIDFLEGRADLEEIVFSPAAIERLTVLVGRSAGKYSSELLASPRMKDLMRELCQQSETNITIFDLPPLLRNDDAILFAPFADATLVVVEDGVTTEDELQQSLHLLDKANVIGTILNKART